jgi:ligand-binding sensor domain-containing protein/putative methionine-R-sulfoxide reductase with GAF domain
MMRLFIVVAMLAQYLFAPAQDISFFHLNTANGLSDNLVTTAVRDKNGILWIGTAEGLNSFDGYTIKKYYRQDYPALSTNYISGLLLDDRNRIWVRQLGGKIVLIDRHRNFSAIPILDENKETVSSTIYLTRKGDILAFNGRKIFRFNEGNPARFEKLKWAEDTSLAEGYIIPAKENTDSVIIIGNDHFWVFDAARMKVLCKMKLPDVISVAWINDEELLATTGRDKQLFRIHFPTKTILRNYADMKDQHGESVKGYLRYMRRLGDGRFLISSGYAGVYILDVANNRLYNYRHDPLNVRSISANNTAHVLAEKSGYVYITTRSAGLNYFDFNNQLATYRSAFQETSSGKIFHGFINCITRHPGGNFWLGTQSGLIEWNREKGTTRFHEYGTRDGAPLNGVEEVRSLCFDKQDRLWAGLNRYGIVVLDKNRKPVKYFSKTERAEEDQLPGNWVDGIVLSPDNKIWVASAGGLAVINPETMKAEKPDSHPLLKKLGKVNCYKIWFRNNNEVWVGTNQGAYRYITGSDSVLVLTEENGLSRRNVLCFNDDNYGNVYAGTSSGLNIIRNGKVVKTFGRSNGLNNERCLGLMKDRNGSIWIGNDNILLNYNPADSSFTRYDDTYGLSPSGFRQGSLWQTEDGEQIWGSDLGISYFFPQQLQAAKFPLLVSVYSFSADNKEYAAGETIRLPFSRNNLSFRFSAIDLFSSKNILYEYRLEGSDEEWKKTSSLQQVVYSNLEPGHYKFRVRASRDGINWTEAGNPADIIIQTPWWKSWWFIVLCILSALACIYYFIRSRNNKVREQKEELETEQAINHFATSMSGQGTVDDTIWDVAKNCIGHLGFEDCVIYLLDEKRNVLVQKAAWGPKTTDENKILNPIEISLGKGIVGAVAKTGKAEIISDTSKDDRYIVDDVRRFSEIAVPVVSDSRVLGVIDSENSRKNYFTQRHLSILTTIASLCANKIVRARAEEEKQKAEKNLSETERQTAEMEMQALRAQMNPHFMFNSLNSINNFILKNDPENASQYLTRFSRLMRLILDNSREEWVLLENEIKALELYIEMEAIRFDNVFEHTIKTALDVNTSAVMVPPMIVQPYVENAIWHGLLHRKEPGSKLLVDIWKKEEKLFIKVEDNGVGRQEAQLLKGKFNSHKKSHGMRITAKRLDMVNKIYKVDAKVHIEDLKYQEGKSAGTSVTLEMKYKTNHVE